jgi:Holliday junction resolvase-like predicted endonuclease
MMPKLERAIETELRRAIKSAGGTVIKLTGAGNPDRIAVFGPSAVFVEVKARGGRLSEAQRVKLRQFADAGHTVAVVTDGALAAYRAGHLVSGRGDVVTIVSVLRRAQQWPTSATSGPMDFLAAAEAIL